MASVGFVADSSVQPGDPEARYITNDLPGCSNGGLLSGTDEADKLAGEDGEDEVRGLGGSDRLAGGRGRDVIYGGPGGDELHASVMQPLSWYTDGSKNTLYGEAGRDFLSGAEGDEVLYGGDDHFDTTSDRQRDELYCGEGKDDYFADKLDYVSSSCEVKRTVAWH